MALHKAIGSPLDRIPDIVHVGGMHVCVSVCCMPSLDPITQMMDKVLMGKNLSRAIPTPGTNGKGSVAYKIAKTMQYSVSARTPKVTWTSSMHNQLSNLLSLHMIREYGQAFLYHHILQAFVSECK